MRTIKLTEGKLIEVISPYAAPARAVDAVAASPGWTVAGTFRVPLDAAGRLEVVGLVSSASLTFRARIYDLTAAAVLSGAYVEMVGPVVDTFGASGITAIPGGHLYQVQVEVVGAAGTGKFGYLKSAQLAT